MSNTPGTIAVLQTIPVNGESPRSVWGYVIANLPDGRTFGVNLGTNASFKTQDPTFETFTGEDASPWQVTRLGEEVRDALVSFLGDSPLAATIQSTPQDGPGETLEQAYQRGVTDGHASATREAEARFEAWKENATQVAHAYADNNDLCSEFDRCMADIGLPTREREYLVTYRVTMPRGEDPWGMDPEDIWDATGGNIGHPVTVESV